MTSKTPHEWSKDALIAKAQRYSSLMLQHDKSEWQFGFWSALTLEMLGRATLANISPTLVASGKEWENIFFALGHQPNTPKFTPKTDDASNIFKKLAIIFPDFTKEMFNFSVAHMDRRNSELHSGALPFDSLGTSSWLPMFYVTCELLLSTIGESLEILFGKEESKTAGTLIQAQKDEAAKAVKGLIDAHSKIWESKDKPEQEKLTKQAELLATRHEGHRVSCPSCKSVALIQGDPSGTPKQTLDDGTIIEKQSMLPSHFECTACGLKIAGFSKLNACGLGDTYTATLTYDAAEYFGVSPDADWGGYEEDFNEP